MDGILEACDGSVVHITAWCPECDVHRKCLVIGDSMVECTECCEPIEQPLKERPKDERPPVQNPKWL